MKKFLSLVIALALLLCSAALVSCGDKINIQSGTTAKPSVSTEPTAAEATAETADTATTEATSETVAADTGKAASSETTASETTASETTASDTTASETTAHETTASESANTVESREPTGISLDYLTTPIKINAKATVRIKGKPDTEYKISVFYSSAASTAKGLEAKISDGDGMVSWTWKVGARTKEGDFKIVISGGGETFTTYFRVTH